ncbi:hypothetical protein [Tychonema sp. LEGE 06208]|nr:hypothetical protein [Tychonema sp. LEGE 06208]MBE9165524.1 hypothetical protein [Tychonema sp. LEGE 06208]
MSVRIDERLSLSNSTIRIAGEHTYQPKFQELLRNITFITNFETGDL